MFTNYFNNKIGHDQFFDVKFLRKQLGQDRLFLLKCNACLKMSILLAEGKIKFFDFGKQKKTYFFVASGAGSLEIIFL